MKTIGTKHFSYSFDDTNETTNVTALLQAEDNGNLKLTIATNKVGPYLSGGKKSEEKNFNVGTVTKPNLGLIRSQTSKGKDYYGFPPEWKAFNGKAYRNVSEMLTDWLEENSVTDSSSSKKQQIIDKLDDLTDIELEKIRKMLRLASILKAGDICTVDKAAFDLRTPETVKVLKKVIKEGNGKVVVEDVEFGYAYVFAYNNPVSRMIGGVRVPEKYLKVVGHKTASDLMRIAQEMERLATPYNRT